jgi:hypothetical protein
MLIGLMVAALVSGCVPIGVRGSSMPLRGAGVGERPAAAAIDNRLATRTHAALRNPSLTS